MRPCTVLELPDPGIRFLPTLADRGGGRLRSLPMFCVESVPPRSDGEQLQRLAEHVELKLGRHMITDDVESAGIAGQVEVSLARDRLPGRGVGGR